MHAGQFFMLLLSFLAICCLFQKFFRQHDESIKQLGSRSGLTFCQPLIWVHTVCKGDDKSHHYTCSKERAFTKGSGCNVVPIHFSPHTTNVTNLGIGCLICLCTFVACSILQGSCLMISQV